VRACREVQVNDVIGMAGHTGYKLGPSFSINALIVLERSEGFSTSPFTPEWEYDAYVMNKGILISLF
jgi:hypothetical protein